MDFNVKNKFYHKTISVKRFFENFDNINIEIEERELTENELWKFANCIPRIVILHEIIDENKNLTYNPADSASYEILLEIYNFNKNLPKDWNDGKLRHSLETNVGIYIVEAEVSNEDAFSIAKTIRY